MLKLLILNIKTLNKSLSKYCTSDSVSSGLIAIYPLRRTEAYSTFYSTFKHVNFSSLFVKLKKTTTTIHLVLILPLKLISIKF